MVDRLVDEEWRSFASQVDDADWVTLFVRRAPDRPAAVAPGRSRQTRAAGGRSAFVVSLLALLCMLSAGMPASGYAADPSLASPLASWLTR